MPKGREEELKQGKAKDQNLFTHRNCNAAVTGFARGNTVQPPGASHGYKSSIQVTVNFHLNPMHVKRNQRRRITSAVNIRLVARDVRIINYPRFRYDGVNH